MLELNQVLTDPGILNNWCAIIVIQELITLIAGFSLLADRAEDTLSAKNIIRKYLKKLALPPNFLMKTEDLPQHNQTF